MKVELRTLKIIFRKIPLKNRPFRTGLVEFSSLLLFKKALILAESQKQKQNKKRWILSPVFGDEIYQEKGRRVVLYIMPSKYISVFGHKIFQVIHKGRRESGPMTIGAQATIKLFYIGCSLAPIFFANNFLVH